MELGLLLLRVLLGALVAGHGLQKAFGWFNGPGLTGIAKGFDAWGFRPGRRMAVIAALNETVGGALMVLGLLTPFAAAVILGTMIVASTPSFRNGFWAVRGGYELPFVYAAVAVCVGFTGPGAYSLDAVLGVPAGVLTGVAALVVGVVGALPVLALRRAALARQPGPTPVGP